MSHNYKELRKTWKFNVFLQWLTDYAFVNSGCCLPPAHYRGKVADLQHVNLILVWEPQFQGRSGFDITNNFRGAKVVFSSAYLYFYQLRKKRDSLLSADLLLHKLSLCSNPSVATPTWKAGDSASAVNRNTLSPFCIVWRKWSCQYTSAVTWLLFLCKTVTCVYVTLQRQLLQSKASMSVLIY